MSTMPALIRCASVLILIGLGMGGCGSLDRLANVGKAPDLSAIEDPTSQPGYKPVHMPMPQPQPAYYAANSLWRNGSRGFFKDQRAHVVGDLVTVRVNITDKAAIDNETKRSRSSGDNMGVTNFFGYENKTDKYLPDGATPGSLYNTNSTMNHDGKGSISRQEQLTTNVAAVVTQVLPNGNLVIEGKQEIRVNYEMRQLIVAGVIRPEDIESDNTVVSTKIAEARIAYGGKGQITDVQQPRYGQQVMDVLLPF
jgi:flagellar L-ring protein precursor FlgH